MWVTLGSCAVSGFLRRSTSSSGRSRSNGRNKPLVPRVRRVTQHVHNLVSKLSRNRRRSCSSLRSRRGDNLDPIALCGVVKKSEGRSLGSRMRCGSKREAQRGRVEGAHAEKENARGEKKRAISLFLASRVSLFVRAHPTRFLYTILLQQGSSNYTNPSSNKCTASFFSRRAASLIKYKPSRQTE